MLAGHAVLDGHVTPVDLDERGGERRGHHVGEPDGDPLPRRDPDLVDDRDRGGVVGRRLTGGRRREDGAPVDGERGLEVVVATGSGW